MSVTFLAISVPSEPENFAGISGFYPIDRISVGVLVKDHMLLCSVAASLAYSAKFGVSCVIAGIAGAAAAAADPGLCRGPPRPAT